MFKLTGRHEWEAWIKEIRLQLNEQLKCFDVRMEERMAIVADIQDFYRKRGEIEIHYSRCLDKVIKDKSTHKEHKQKREWSLISDIYQELINQNKSTSRDHAALSDVYCVHLVDYLDQVMEDTQRIYKRCREIGYAIHEEILRVLHELYTTMKTYQTYYAEVRQAETKLCVVERQRDKLEMANTNSREKLARSKKYKLIEKEINKKKNKYQEAKLKALKAKNEYQLCLQASNATIHKYFVDDLSDIIDLMDFGFDNCIARALLMHCSAEEGRQRSIKSGAEQLATLIGALDSRADKQRFLEYYHPAFMIPKKFEFQGCEDEMPEAEIQKMLRTEMEQRLQQLQQRVTCLRIESEEVWKTLETAESSLLEMQTIKDHDCSRYFGENAVSTSASMSTETLKLRANRQETEEFYLTKFREYLLGTSKIARLNAKQEYIRQSLLDGSNASPIPSISATKQKQARRKRIGRLQLSTQTKLFGGSLEEYLENTKEEIPLIMRSCIRIINLYGMQHQGIFRISGSQLEINNFKECFERGEDPLAEVSDVSDINSVAGVFKLYLRELREPLFPIIYFEKLIEISKINSRNEIVIKLKELIATFPQKIIVVMRYLFAFLNHLAEYSDESMMDSSNLAICFGPTLVNIPEDYDQVLSQNNINDVIKYFIMYQEEIFPDDLGGIKYEKYISEELDDVDIEESSIELTQEEPDTQDSFCSEEEIDVSLEDLAHRNSNTRLEEQLSYKKDDSLPLFKKSSKDCCRAGLNRKEGLTYMQKERGEIQQKTSTSSLTESGLSNNYSLPMKSDLSNPNISSEPPSDKADGHNGGVITSVAPNDAHTSFPSTSLQPSTSREANTEISSRLTRMSTFSENEKYSKYYRNNIDGVLQVDPEYNVECIDGDNHAIVNMFDTVFYANLDLQSQQQQQQQQQQQRGNNNHEITNPEQNLSSTSCYVHSVPHSMPSLEDMKRGTDRKQQHWKSQSVCESAVMMQQHQPLQLPHANSVSKGTENSRESVASSRAVTTSTTMTSDNESQQKQQTTTNFSVNRELWQRRATSQTQLILPGAKSSSYSRATQEFREMRQKHTPDLVMDLPLMAQELVGKKSTSSLPQQQQTSASRTETATSPTVRQQCSCPESPDMSTAAERFAKQNQCTLKKNTKIANSENAGGNSKLKQIETAEHEESGAIIDAENENQLSSFKPQVKVKPTILRKPVLPFPHPHMSPELARKIEKQMQHTEQFN